MPKILLSGNVLLTFHINAFFMWSLVRQKLFYLASLRSLYVYICVDYGHNRVLNLKLSFPSPSLTTELNSWLCLTILILKKFGWYWPLFCADLIETFTGRLVCNSSRILFWFLYGLIHCICLASDILGNLVSLYCLWLLFVLQHFGESPLPAYEPTFDWENERSLFFGQRIPGALPAQHNRFTRMTCPYHLHYGLAQGYYLFVRIQQSKFLLFSF